MRINSLVINRRIFRKIPLYFSSFLFFLFYSITIAANETAVAHYLQSIQNDPNQLRIFLQRMPKGADLHSHSFGEAYAEDLLRYAANPEDHYCLDPKTFTVTQHSNCLPENQLAHLLVNSQLYDATINAWSMRNFIANNNESAHDHFFATFNKFALIAGRYEYKILADAMERAAAQNMNYLEMMVTPYETKSASIGKQFLWTGNLAKLHQELVAAGLLNVVPELAQQIDKLDTAAKHELFCGTAKAKAGCSVKIKYLYQTLREQSPSALFAQLLLAFATVQQNPQLVGINIVQPEDGYLAMHNYLLDMQMIKFLHKVYPKVNIALHAGELYFGLVRPEDLRFHIGDAVYVGQAQRIGHGVSMAFEDNAKQVLKEMAQKHILVEVNLTSNAKILGVQNNFHPLPLYLNHHVPVAISTDDEGVLRTDLTNEYVRAILSYHLTYKTIKQLVRNSLSYSFLPGRSLWQNPDQLQPVAACSHDNLGSLAPSERCFRFLKGSEKAREQWDLEKRFHVFESSYIH